MNKKVIITFLVMLVVAAAAIGGFFILSRYVNEDVSKVSETSELGKLLNKDLESSYPATPREVVKFYNRINSMMYANEITEEQFSDLLKQMRKLFDEELLAENDFEKQLEEFKKDVKDYEENSKSIVSYNLPENSLVNNYKIDGAEMASLDVGYMMKEKDEYTKMTEEFILRQDAGGKWKILGWSIKTEEGKEE